MQKPDRAGAGRGLDAGRQAAGRGAKAAGRGIKAAGHGVGATARLIGRGTKGGTQQFRRFAAADGAGESGLARLTEMHAVQVAGDAALTVALAGTVFAMPTGQAKGQVALFLLTTMAPFALLAPVIGPILDRFQHGRRWAIGTTMALRAFLAWVLAGLVLTGSEWLFPTALGCLMASKAYAVARASAVPRLTPRGFSLVTANSRLSIAGLIGMALGGAIAGPLSRIGPDWSLRAAFASYVVATILAIRLPAQVDSEPRVASGHHRPAPARAGLLSRVIPRIATTWRRLPRSVIFALAACTGARMLSGFVTLFLAFLVREAPLPGWNGTVVLGCAVGAAGLGNAAGSLVGNRLRGPSPDRVAAALPLVAILSIASGAFWWSIWTVVAIGVMTGLWGQLGKLCLDAIVQRDVSEEYRARTFSFSETTLQIFWVLGGAAGISAPMNGQTGFGIIFLLVLLSYVIALTLRSYRRQQQASALQFHGENIRKTAIPSRSERRANNENSGRN